MGWSWYAGYNWMDQFDEKEANASDEELWDRGSKDLRGAFYANVFIFLATTNISKGAHVEIGARLTNKMAGDFYIVGATKPYYFFYKAPWIKHVETDEELLKCVS